MFLAGDVIRAKINNQYQLDQKEYWKILEVHPEWCRVVKYSLWRTKSYGHNQTCPLEMKHYNQYELLEKYKHKRKKLKFQNI